MSEVLKSKRISPFTSERRKGSQAMVLSKFSRMCIPGAADSSMTVPPMAVSPMTDFSMAGSGFGARSNIGLAAMTELSLVILLVVPLMMSGVVPLTPQMLL